MHGNNMAQVPLIISSPCSCSYLPDLDSQFIFVSPRLELSTYIYSQLIEQGFRRSGNDLYRPQCKTCQACISSRILATHFEPNRSQARCLAKNRSINAIITPAEFQDEHYDLYLRYQKSRHTDSNMAQSSPEEYISFLSSDWCNTLFIEFRQQQQLLAVAIVDVLEYGVSAVYTFFDPEFSNLSLGTYAVLWQIEQVKKMGLKYVYLGYWIEKCPKMAYKINYQPLEGYVENAWRSLNLANRNSSK
jgi:arginyl-tRNA--protein-N-Asp/Glu arginylyltransferase